MFKQTLIVVLTVCLCACAGTSSRVRIAADNFYEGNFERSIRYLQRPAQKGEPEAQYALGYMLYYGKGVTEDKAEAVKWLQLAAAQGHAKAQEALRLIHRSERKHHSLA